MKKLLIFFIIIIPVFSYAVEDPKLVAEMLFKKGMSYELGRDDVKQDYNRAAELYLSAASEGHKVAQFRLGEMYRSGNGVEKDFKKAAYWYNLSAKQGHSRAKGRLGQLRKLGHIPPLEEPRAGYGSGFFVNSKHVITNEHVIRNCPNITMHDGENTIEADIIAKDSILDLAVLSFPNYENKHVAMLADKAAIREQELIVTGFSKKYFDILPVTVIDPGRPLYVLIPDQDRYSSTEHVFINGGASPGDSGGAVIDQWGNVVAVNRAKRWGLKKDQQKRKSASIAIHLSTLKKFLNAHNIEYQITHNGLPELDSMQIENLAKRFSVKVQCGENQPL